MFTLTVMDANDVSIIKVCELFDRMPQKNSSQGMHFTMA